ncbi:hypothetical protein T06_13822, partial [Trichinella sp. T6]
LLSLISSFTRDWHSHKNLNVLEIARSVVVSTDVDDAGR